MHASRYAIFFLSCLIALASARPFHHRHRRSQCRPVTNTAMSSTPTATTTASHHAVDVASHHGSPTLSYSGKPEGPQETSKTGSGSASSGNSGSSSSDGLLGQLFPVADSVKSWTTCPDSPDALALDDSVFRPEKVMKSLPPHPYVAAPDGTKSMRVFYPQGSYNFDQSPYGGVSMYGPGPANVDLSTAEEATFSYSVYFPDGFDFVKGGKLPGLYGGDSPGEATGCSGGRRDNGCWSARFMWRTNGAGELYTYLPPSYSQNKKVCNVPPESDCNDTYGASVGRGSFKFSTGSWTTVSQRVRLNTPGQANGELQVWANGRSVISVDGLVLRDSPSGKVQGIQVQSFFGGNSKDYATPTNQYVYFKDFSASILQT